jgi:hypothetical protein
VVKESVNFIQSHLLTLYVVNCEVGKGGEQGSDCNHSSRDVVTPPEAQDTDLPEGMVPTLQVL